MTYDVYLDSRVLAADPMELVRMLYDGALESIRAARQALTNRDIAGRARMISKAVEILSELALSVDVGKGGSLAQNLIELYDYMQRRLLQANAQQTEAGLIEVEKLLCTLQEAWASCPMPAAAESASSANAEAAGGNGQLASHASAASGYGDSSGTADYLPEENLYTGSGLALRF